MMETACTAIVNSDPFKYTALNLQAPSIRLIRLKPDLSRDGHIQCELRHSSIEDDYVCLSYVWGNDSAGQWIFINGKLFWVRENLWRFLWSTWQKRIKDSRSTWHWIDALCIDQENNIERGHQVQQMGRIYAQASMVISWLGWDKKIENFLSAAASQKNGKVIPGKDLRLCDSEYWSRAWVTQELMLGRSVILSAGTAGLPFEKLDSCCCPRDDFSERFCRNVYNMQPGHREGFKGLSMFQLLAHFDMKKSTIPRDKIFSLLAISRDSATIKADYNISDKELVCKILRTREPLVCLCSVRNLCNVLEISDFSLASDNASFASIALMNGWKTLGDRCSYIGKPLLAFDEQLFAVNLDDICQAVAFGGGYLVAYAKF